MANLSRPLVDIYNGLSKLPPKQITVNSIMERFHQGEFSGTSAEHAVMQLLQIIEEDGHAKGRYDRYNHDMNKIIQFSDELEKKNNLLHGQIQNLKAAFPPPECEDCSCEMSFENHGNQDFYICTDCYEGGCTCFQGHAPCSWCMHIIIADDWMLEHSSEHRAKKRAEKNHFEHLTREEGPSAAAAAKPVTKLIITCQGDWSPWEENL
jgi:hypothetical protein